MTEEKDFEDRLMEKFPNLFPKDKNGKVKHSECGVGCPEIWQPLVENLCASIDYHVKNYKQYKQSNKIRRTIHDFFYYPLINCIMRFLITKLKPVAAKQEVFFFEESCENTKYWRNKVFMFLRNLETKIRPKYKWTCTSAPSVTIAQVKSKFNSLRFYYDGGDDHVAGMVCLAETLAYQMFPLRKK